MASLYFKIQVKGFKHDFNVIKALPSTSTVGKEIYNLIKDIDDEIISSVQAGQGNEQFKIQSMDTPVHVIYDLGYKSLTVHLKSKSSTDVNNNANKGTTIDAFEILKKANRHYTTYPKLRDEKTQKDTLFNNVIGVLKKNEVGFTPIQVENIGNTVVTTLTSVLWFMDGRHNRFEARGISLPDMFQSLRGYRSYKEQHKRIPNITSEELKGKLDELGELLLLPWILNPKFSKFKKAVEELLQRLQKFYDFLKSVAAKSQSNMNSTEPVRNLNENWVLQVKEGSSEEVDKSYKILFQTLGRYGLYEPVDLSDLEPDDKEIRRKWLNNMSLPYPFTKFTYRHGNYLGNLNMIWKIPVDIRQRKSEVECKLVQDILSQVPLYRTRQMQREFIVRYSSFAQPVVLRNMFKFLTDFEYSPATAAETEIDLRFCQALLNIEDTEFIFDLRKYNGRPVSSDFDCFWTELEKFLDEKSVVHERRHSDVNYMPFAISVEDLRQEIKDRLPQEAKVPSLSWLKLNFSPANPFKNSALNYTGRFKVKFKVQQRLLRSQHEDMEFCRNQFNHLKAFSCKYRDFALFQSLDDKAIVPVGEPNQAISTGVRIHHGGIVTGEGQNLAMDHDFHIAGIVPSVCFAIDIPTHPHDSFYNGLVHVTVKDKVFQASSPLRHTTETVSLIREKWSSDGVNMEKPILVRYSDGGPDHRVTYRSVQICSLVEFIALDLDMMICARTAPSMSYLNPAERTMSVLNLALQNVALRREKMLPEFEMMAKGKTLTGLRNVAQKSENFKKNYSESVGVPLNLVKTRFGRLKWKGENITTHDACTDEDMKDLLSTMLHVIDSNVDVDPSSLTKTKSDKIDQFLQKHARCRHYIFQIKKCCASDCSYCNINPPRMPPDVFESLCFVPDSTPSDNGYKSFEELYGTETDDSGRPSLKHKPQLTDRDKKFKALLVGTRVRGFVSCCECGKRRVVYSSKRLTSKEENALKRVQEELLFVCGSVLFPGGEYQDTIVVKEGQSCNSPIEVTYYADKTVVFDPVCFHCGDTEVADTEQIRRLKEDYGIVRPICETCLNEGKPVATRNAVKTKKRK